MTNNKMLILSLIMFGLALAVFTSCASDADIESTYKRTGVPADCIPEFDVGC